ncbi:type II toxin-antitoxin system VapC family toxin [Hippea alviniae]|uniref:type II toxin-antitoxin system VapC family toxin n=1 Tax=Hippea alviniae TaxID=1279027 RepID=UPI0009DBB308|nr:type II toxin-antitoxin system VapC family toxin [Hippea alviniae]
MSSKTVLVDTNVLIYAIDLESRFHSCAVKFLSNSSISLFTTSKNISEFLVVLTRNRELSLSVNECWRVLNSLLKNFTILYLFRFSLSIFKELTEKYEPKGLRIHDVEIASIGISFGVSTILTNNPADFDYIDEFVVEPLCKNTEE